MRRERLRGGPEAVVPGIDPLEDGPCEFATALPVMLVEQLEPKGLEEAVGHAVIEAVAGRPHRSE
jgi:hypothetical protein